MLALNKVPYPRSLRDFRLISLLFILSKVLEGVVFNQISIFVETERLLDWFQSGYRENRSTETTLFKLTEYIRQGKEKQLFTTLMLFDFSKVFAIRR